MSRQGQGRNYRDGQGRSSEYGRSPGRPAYPEAGQLNHSVAAGLIEVDGLGGIETFELSGVLRVVIAGNDLVVFLDHRMPSEAYYADADHWLRGGGIPDPVFLGCETQQDRIIIRGTDVAGVQVDLGGRNPAFFRFRAQRRVA